MPEKWISKENTANCRTTNTTLIKREFRLSHDFDQLNRLGFGITLRSSKLDRFYSNIALKYRKSFVRVEV